MLASLALPGTELRVKVATFCSSPGTGCVIGGAVPVLTGTEPAITGATLLSTPGTGCVAGGAIPVLTGVLPRSPSECTWYCGVCTAM